MLMGRVQKSVDLFVPAVSGSRPHDVDLAAHSLNFAFPVINQRLKVDKRSGKPACHPFCMHVIPQPKQQTAGEWPSIARFEHPLALSKGSSNLQRMSERDQELSPDISHIGGASGRRISETCCAATV